MPPPVPVMKPIPVKATDDGCLERIPYASLMATVLCFLGVILFSIMMIWGFDASTEQSQRFLRREKWPWLDKIEVFFISLAVLMSLFALFFVIIGFTATGATRENMYRASSARRGGRCMVVFVLFCCYLLLACWLVIFAFTSTLVFTYFIFDRTCSGLRSYTEGDCLDFSFFRTILGSVSPQDLHMCGGDIQQFCALSATAHGWFWVGWAGAVLVILGLVQYVAAHASNYSHIGNACKYIEIRDSAADGLGAPIPPPLSKIPKAPPPPKYRPTPSEYDSSEFNQRYTSHDLPRHRRGSADERDRYTYSASAGMSSSSTHLAAKHSDSVSGYQYPRKGRRAYN